MFRRMKRLRAECRGLYLYHLMLHGALLWQIKEYLKDKGIDAEEHSIRRDIDLFNEDTTLGDIWDAMLQKKEQISCIIDEYGWFQGILTLEDIIETLLEREIVDENDTVPNMQALAKEIWEMQQKRRK